MVGGQAVDRLSWLTQHTSCRVLVFIELHRKAASKQAAHNHSQHGRQAAAAATAYKALPLSWLDIFVLSALAKIGATLVTYPLLVVKNRLQVGSARCHAEAGA
jgi:hypothetical protein